MKPNTNHVESDFRKTRNSARAKVVRTVRPKAGRGARLQAGQAVVEYVLLVAMMTVIFGAMFNMIRQSLYRLWICELAPRIQTPAGCKDGATECMQTLQSYTGTPPPPNCPH